MRVLEHGKCPCTTLTTEMRNYVLILGLLFLSLNYFWNQLICCTDNDIRSCKLAASPVMALRYIAGKLMNLKRNYFLANDTFELCRNVGILRPMRYMHRASRRKFIHDISDSISVPVFQRKTNRLLCNGVDFNNLSVLKRVEIAPSFLTLPSLVKSALFNARSVNNKAVILSYTIIEKKLDLVCLTETWHKQGDGLMFNELTPSGYGLFDAPRPSGRGGGIVVLYNQKFTISPVVIPQFNSFECLVLSVSAPITTVIATVYRPPKTTEHFLSEFAELLSMLCLKFERTLILGDFNIHIDKKDSAMTKDFLSLLECFDLKQLVDCSTHIKGHTLDLVIANGSFVSQFSSADLGLSDYFAIFF